MIFEQSMAIEEKPILPKNLCRKTAQKVINIFIMQLKKGNLFDSEVKSCLMGILPQVEEVVCTENNNCNFIITKALIKKIDVMKKKIIEKENLSKRKDYFTRFLLKPIEKKICQGSSLEITAENFPREIIPLFKQKMELFLPYNLLDKSKKLVDRTIMMHPCNKNPLDTAWNEIEWGWRVVQTAISSYKKEDGSIDWKAVQYLLHTKQKDKFKIVKLKTIKELSKVNGQIRNNLVLELTCFEGRKQNGKKQKEIIKEHIFVETGMEPTSAQCEVIHTNLIKVLSNGDKTIKYF